MLPVLLSQNVLVTDLEVALTSKLPLIARSKR